MANPLKFTITVEVPEGMTQFELFEIIGMVEKHELAIEDGDRCDSYEISDIKLAGPLD